MILLVSGCAANNNDSISNSLDFYEQTQNYHKMIALYKAELKTKENDNIRTKLANAYLSINDYESSLFTLAPLLQRDKVSIAILEIKAKALYKNEEFDNALITCEKIIAKNDVNSDIENLMGLIYAENNNYEQSRHYFNRARTHFHDDIIIQNNLAVLDLLEGHPQASITRLMPLYTKYPSDIKIKANLIIAFSQIDDVNAVRSILAASYSQREIDEIVKELIELKPI
ncbi:Flp pilus assembly protein TadD, contains TPR repeat [Moritella sp. JT01]|nr:Flp pilus assembly protein TadD, contains TPR repeat [Moritella sp. JT01]